MGTTLDLTASDGFALSAYRADPAGPPRGAVVVLQEIFGVNGHIRRVADGYAADGYVAIAPALFDRHERGLELGYGPEDRPAAIAAKAASDTDAALRDIDAARADVAGAGPVAVVGYCWGGYLAWLAATRLPGFSAASSYYGGGIGSAASETPRCPAIAHFGEKDAHVGLDQADAVRRAHPTGVEVFVYPADHGFNCDDRPSYDPESAALARERTLALFASALRR